MPKKTQKRKTQTPEKAKSNYQVVVGNLGIVYDGPSKKDAQKDFKYYRDKSSSRYGGLVCGEEVALLQGDDQLDIHEGWMHLFADDVEQTDIDLNAHRKKNPDQCFACGNHAVESAVPIVQDGTHPDIEVVRRCTDCGFEWTEEYTFEAAYTDTPSQRTAQ